jgi:hypothetical protein
MNQLLPSLIFCLQNAKYLFILFLPAITLDVVQLYLLLSYVVPLFYADMSQSELLEALQSMPTAINTIGIFSNLLFIVLSGALPILFLSVKQNTKTPNQPMFQALKKFFPLFTIWLIFYFMLMAYLVSLTAYFGIIGLIIVVVTFLYLFVRIGLAPTFIVLNNKSPIEAVRLSFAATSEHLRKLLKLITLCFFIQFGLSLISFWLFGANILFIIFSTLLKYFILAIIFYLLFTLYEAKYQNN